MASNSRASFPEDLKSLRKFLPTLLKKLEAEPHWYASIYFERKARSRYTCDFKKQDITTSTDNGIVFRIYDGKTLHEQATDDLSSEGLERQTLELVKRVKSKKIDGPNQLYPAPSWKERLSENIDQEILSQIPKGATSSTEVHFGIRYEIDPLKIGGEERVRNLKKVLEEITEAAVRGGFKREQISYMNVRDLFAIEDSIFLDREVNLSQRLFRSARAVNIMSGSQRTFVLSGGLGGYEATVIPDSEITSAIEDLLALTHAERLSPGKYRVLVAPSVAGTFAHEAFGHSQEADTCVRGRSKAWELYKTGEIVGNEHATILNNPALFKNGTNSYAAWGSYFFDEEGWLAQSQTILDEGKLTSPMTNLTSAIRLGIKRTANGKRESWRNGVYTRQTNTYFSQGNSTFQELLAQIDDGFLATHSAGGMEDPKGMGIQVGISYLKEVKNGKLTGRVFRGPAGGDIQMTGYTPDLLKSIIGKTKIDAFDEGPEQYEHPLNDSGGCGKYHKEFVHAGVGGPYMLIDDVLLG